MTFLHNLPDRATETVEDAQQTVIPDFIIESMARCLLPALYDVYESDEGKRSLSAGGQKAKSPHKSYGPCRCWQGP